jgi:SAM-dependent methyltransferase
MEALMRQWPPVTWYRLLRGKYRSIAHRVYVATDAIRIFLYRLLHRDVAAVPPASNRIRAGDRTIGEFMRAGRNCYRPIKAAIARYNQRPEPLRVLDFGSGAGRVLQYFARENLQLYACDVDATAIQYLQKSFPAVSSRVSHYEPPLPYENGLFDIVYSVSVWTHLAPHLQLPWLLEMDRILMPGGLGLLTTIGPFGYRRGSHLSAVTFSLEELMRNGFCYSEYKAKDRSAGPSYGAAYHTAAYVMKEWGKYVDVLEVQEGVVDDLNDLVVLRKRWVTEKTIP